jgi:uncharacterized protein (DUF924 family)
MTSPDLVLHFWFKELTPEQWFKKDPDLDLEMKRRFSDLHARASQSELFPWRSTLLGRLAEIIVLDQFSRNIYRTQARSFAQDPLALGLAQEATRTSEHLTLPPEKKIFLYMPFMHSESLLIHEEAVRLFSQPGLKDNLDYELRHQKIIHQFGRFPHRNEILGRSSSKEEIEFLKQPGSGF